MSALADHFPIGCWYQPDGSYAGECSCGGSFAGASYAEAKEAWADHATPPASKGVERQTVAQCLAIIRKRRDEFLSPEYATPQPVGSFQERFACDQCAEAIEDAFSIGSTEQRQLLAASPTPSNDTLQGRGEVERLREALAAEDEYWAASRILAAAFARIRPQAQAAFDAASMRRELARAALQKDTRHDG